MMFVDMSEKLISLLLNNVTDPKSRGNSAWISRQRSKKLVEDIGLPLIVVLNVSTREIEAGIGQVLGGTKSKFIIFLFQIEIWGESLESVDTLANEVYEAIWNNRGSISEDVVMTDARDAMFGDVIGKILTFQFLYIKT